jgi:hypothetical protein
MKTFSASIAVLVLLAPAAFGQANIDHIKAQARAVTGQNRTPPGPAPAPTPAYPTPMLAPVKPSVQQQNISRLKADLANVHQDGKATDQSKQAFAKDLMAAVQGSSKPGTNSLARLADSLLPALAPKNVLADADDKLVLKIVIMLNSRGLSSTRLQEIADEAQTALQSAGVPADEAARIAGDLHAVAADIQSAVPL